jgi:hypothetical protein
MVLTANYAFCQLSKEETLTYINDVYKESFTGNMHPMKLTVHYQNLVVEYLDHTSSVSLKDSITYVRAEDSLHGTSYWNIVTPKEILLNRISSEDNCKRLYKALLHLQEFVRKDTASKDPFAN